MKKFILLFAVLCATSANGEEPPEIEYSLTYGTAFTWTPAVRSSALNLSLEKDLIPNSVSVEIGISPGSSTDGSREMPISLQIKKAYLLAPDMELEFGIGPELEEVTNTPNAGWFTGLEATTEIMYWRWGRWGLSFEASFSYLSREGGERSGGIAVGGLFGF